MCKCGHHKIVPICIILIGLAFLAGELGVLAPDVVAASWPILLVVIGGIKLFGPGCKCC